MMNTAAVELEIELDDADILEARNADARPPRVGSDLEVHVRTDRGPVRCRATNLSLTGIFLAGVKAPVGRQVALSIAFPGEAPRRVTGRVVRSVPGAAAGVALTFSSIGWDDLLCLARYLAPRL